MVQLGGGQFADVKLGGRISRLLHIHVQSPSCSSGGPFRHRRGDLYHRASLRYVHRAVDAVMERLEIGKSVIAITLTKPPWDPFGLPSWHSRQLKGYRACVTFAWPTAINATLCQYANASRLVDDRLGSS
jgi:hypothetical protein